MYTLPMCPVITHVYVNFSLTGSIALYTTYIVLFVSGMVGADLSLLPSHSASPLSSRLALIAGTSSCLMAVSIALSLFLL